MRQFNFIGRRNMFFVVSLIIIGLGLVFGFVRGLNLDIDFLGGTYININMKTNQFDINNVRRLITENTKVTNPTILIGGFDRDQISIRTVKALTTDESEMVFSTISQEYGLEEEDLMSVDTIEPLIGRELKTNSIFAVLGVSFLMLIYLVIAFRKLGGFTAGLTAIIGIVHDLLILITVYLVFYIPINIAFIAASLTILGYSLNDTIIVYDRIRENDKLLRKMPVSEVVNKSINQTLARTISTSLTVVLTISVLYIFGLINNIGILVNFTLPLIVGVISGTYSSIFICSPLFVIFSEYINKREKVARVKA